MGSLVSVRNIQPAGTPGGAATVGSWITRVLNTVLFGTWVTLSGNRITLGPGIYRIKFSAKAAQVDKSQVRLRDITLSADLATGDGAYSPGGAGTSAGDVDVTGETVVVVPASGKVIELQQQFETTNAATFEMGVAGGFAAPSIFSQVDIEQL
jgi:hypothetical protein